MSITPQLRKEKVKTHFKRFQKFWVEGWATHQNIYRTLRKGLVEK